MRSLRQEEIEERGIWSLCEMNFSTINQKRTQKPPEGKKAQEARLRGWEWAERPTLDEEVGFKPRQGRSVPCSSRQPEYQYVVAISTQVRCLKLRKTSRNGRQGRDKLAKDRHRQGRAMHAQ